MKLSPLVRIVLTAAAAVTAAHAQAQSAAKVDMSRLLNADKERGQWMSHSRTLDEHYFSPLDRINEKNVGTLGLAWRRTRTSRARR